MFKWLKRQPITPAEQKLEQIIAIMFPPLTVHVDKEGNKFHVDHAIDTNVEAALTDLQDGYNDKATQKTLQSMADRLVEVRRILQAYAEIDVEAKYFIVDDDANDSINHIEAASV